MAGKGTVVIKLLGDAAQLQRTLGDVEKTTKSFGDKLTGVGSKLTAGLTVPLVAGLGLATKAAVEDEAAQQKLAKTLENTVGATDKVVKKVEEQITAFQKVSTFTDDELRPSFAALVSETRNVEEAQNLMRTAMDLAAARGIPLEEAANILVKAHNGQTRALAALGIETKNTEGTAASFSSVMEDVNSVVGGQAQAALDTTAGKAAVFKRDLGEMGEEIGQNLLPILGSLAEKLTGVLGEFEKLPDPVKNTMGAILLASVAAGPVLTLAGNLQKLATALTAVNAAGNSKVLTLLGKLAPIAAGAGLVQQYVESGGEEGVGLGKGHTPVGIIRGLVEGVGDLFTGRAAGGPVMAGRPYLVGERGPELFVPGASGSIVPGGGGGGPPVVVQLVLDRRVLAQVSAESLRDLQRRSGSLGLVAG